MSTLYCRVNPRTELQKRDRAGLRFCRDWSALTDVDEATLAALHEDPYLEVSEKPTVLVEVAATVETVVDAAIEATAEVEAVSAEEQSTEATVAEAVVEQSRPTGKKAK